MFKSQFYRTEGTGFPAGPETIGGGGGGCGRGDCDHQNLMGRLESMHGGSMDT